MSLHNCCRTDAQSSAESTSKAEKELAAAKKEIETLKSVSFLIRALN